MATQSNNNAKTAVINREAAAMLVSNGKIQWANVEGKTANDVAEGSILDATVSGFKSTTADRNGAPVTTLYATANLKDGRPVKFRVQSEADFKALNIGASAMVRRDNLTADPAQGRDRDVAYFTFLKVNATSSAPEAVVEGQTADTGNNG